jgi:hypothetical protein
MMSIAPCVGRQRHALLVMYPPIVVLGGDSGASESHMEYRMHELRGVRAGLERS